MKRLFTLLPTFLLAALLMAQAPETLNYQGVARNAQGQPYANQSIAVRLKIHNGTAAGAVVYSETRTLTTNTFGLFNVTINGAGGTKSGDFATINWSNGAKFLETEIDPTGGSNFISVGTTQMQSVAYSLLSAKASRLALPYSETVNANNTLFDLTNTGTGHGMWITASQNTGVIGRTQSSSGTTAGVWGDALYGNSSGVRGQSMSATGTGVYALNIGGGLALSVDGNVKIAGGNTTPGAGKVLTSDASGNATWQAPQTAPKIGFSVHSAALGGLQNIQNNQASKVHFRTEEFDPGSDYTLYNQGSATNESSSYKAPVSGLYHFDAHTTISCTGGFQIKQLTLRLKVKRNGTITAVYAFIEHGTALYANRSVEASRTIHLNAGDQVWLEITPSTDNNSNPMLSQSITNDPVEDRTLHHFAGFLIFAD